MRVRGRRRKGGWSDRDPRANSFEVAIEQIKIHAADTHQPHLGREHCPVRVLISTVIGSPCTLTRGLSGRFSTLVSRYSST